MHHHPNLYFGFKPVLIPVVCLWCVLDMANAQQGQADVPTPRGSVSRSLLRRGSSDGQTSDSGLLIGSLLSEADCQIPWPVPTCGQTTGSGGHTPAGAQTPDVGLGGQTPDVGPAGQTADVGLAGQTADVGGQTPDAEGLTDLDILDGGSTDLDRFLLEVPDSYSTDLAQISLENQNAASSGHTDLAPVQPIPKWVFPKAVPAFSKAAVLARPPEGPQEPPVMAKRMPARVPKYARQFRPPTPPRRNTKRRKVTGHQEPPPMTQATAGQTDSDSCSDTSPAGSQAASGQGSSVEEVD